MKKYVVYVYDIKTKFVDDDKKNYNTIKRRFYSKLNNLLKKAIIFKADSKSMLITFISYEKIVDDFFVEFKRWIKVYKIITTEIYEL